MFITLRKTLWMILGILPFPHFDALTRGLLALDIHGFSFVI